jgi:hypothetical protein
MALPQSQSDIEEMIIPTLPLRNMSERHPGLTLEVAAFYLQAAQVSLDRLHTSPTEFTLSENDEDQPTEVEWDATDVRIRSAWDNDTDRTEAGAYACSLAAVEIVKGLVAVSRAETRTGADYYVAPAGYGKHDLENCFRLEVSGIDQGDVGLIASRLRVKLKQTKNGRSNLPAIAAVTGFKAKVIMLQVLSET